MSKKSEHEAWVPRCFGREYADVEVFPEICKPCPFCSDCEFFCNERKAKAVG